MKAVLSSKVKLIPALQEGIIYAAFGALPENIEYHSVICSFIAGRVAGINANVLTWRNQL